MKVLTAKELGWWTGLALMVGVLPLGGYWAWVARVPSVEVSEAKAWLSRPESSARLLDVRADAFSSSNPVIGAESWPAANIALVSSPEEIPAAWRDQRLIVLSDDPWDSARAVARLRAVGAGEVYRVSGGLMEWRAYGDGQKSDLPFQTMRLAEQWLAVIVAFGVKPVYMILSLLLIIWLWRQPALDLAALRWGLIWFWLGENACSIDYLFYARGSDFWEYLHGYGMVVGFAFIIYAFLEGLDWRLVKFSPENERCAGLTLCRACVKYAEVPCGLKRLFTIMIPAGALLAIMPFCAPYVLTSYETKILGTTHHYYHMVSSQWFELRYCAVVALLLFAASWLVLLVKRNDAVRVAKALFAAGAGALGFGLLRMFLVSTFRANLLWFDVWEEVTELLAIFSIGIVLWVFREGLLGKRGLVHGKASASA